MDSFLLLAFLFLVAGVIAVPIASRLGLGSVIGYLLAGIAISPLLRQLDVDVVSIQHFAEFGVVIMLFLVGLELEPHMLWSMRRRVFGLGGVQVGTTAAAIMVIAMAFGQPWQTALAIGLVLSLSSTAIVLHTLNEKGLMRSDGGKASFSVLLCQDLAVIPMLALVPLLALPELVGQAAGGAAGPETPSLDAGQIAAAAEAGEAAGLGLPGWQHALLTFGAIIAIAVGGSLLTRQLFHFIGAVRLRELFTGAALLIVIGIALLMTVIGLPAALGTFLAGVVLANSEYRHELESDLHPFKGLLLGLFFITVGAAVELERLFGDLGTILAMTITLIALKCTVLYALSRFFGIGAPDRWLFTLGLAQAGEFGFVLLSFAVASAVIPAALAEQLSLVVALSMLLTPLLFIAYDRLVAPRFEHARIDGADDIDEPGSVIIAGVGRFGGIVNLILLSSGFKTVVLDYQSEQLERLRAFGVKAFFGDAMRPDLLHAAGIEKAKLLVVAIEDRENATKLVRYVTRRYPHVHLVVRAVDRHHFYELWSAGARDIVRETFDASIGAARAALEALGVDRQDAERRTQTYVVYDYKHMRETADLYDPTVPDHRNVAYVEKTKQYLSGYADAVRGRRPSHGQSWTPPPVGSAGAGEDPAAPIVEG